VGNLQRMRRVAWVAGTVSVVGFVVEIAIIVAAAAMQTTSHFNVTTPLHAALWSVMAASIVVIWAMSLIVCLALFRNGPGDPARTRAIRSGAVIAIIGMGLAYLMTAPTADQLENYQGIVGAHTVGLPDGGPGLPLLGWSTVAGDLRIPHFVGMHALQALPLYVIALEVLARRWPRLGQVRLRLTTVAVAAYGAGLAVVTWQALAGQSIVRPAGPVLVAGVVVAVGAIGAFAGVLATARPTGGPVAGDGTAPTPAVVAGRPGGVV
ncbi:hypothetical protein PU560_10165, partial [Georgenia sp. 10Sc9-8]|nr:hypothetical protein [Georgenia halotolerans]